MENNELEFVKRYSCNLVLENFGIEGQQKLKRTKVLIIGLGGIGSVISIYLTANGIGKLGLCDFDFVDFNNLTRQILYNTFSIGKPKTIDSYEKLSLLNPEVELAYYNQKLEHNNILDLISNYDIIAECTDSLETKFMINKYCLENKKKVFICSAIAYESNIIKILNSNNTCMACIFEHKIPQEQLLTCANLGVFPTLPGITGLFAATEIIKEIIGLTNENNFIKINVKNNIVRFLNITKRQDCNLH